MTDTTAPRTAAAVTQGWLDSWPEGATYTFTKDQIETVIASVRLDEAEAIEPLLALVRAAVELNRTWQNGYPEDADHRADLHAALATLPADILADCGAT
jgi:hypothetical protein